MADYNDVQSILGAILNDEEIPEQETEQEETPVTEIAEATEESIEPTVPEAPPTTEEASGEFDFDEILATFSDDPTPDVPVPNAPHVGDTSPDDDEGGGEVESHAAPVQSEAASDGAEGSVPPDESVDGVSDGVQHEPGELSLDDLLAAGDDDSPADAEPTKGIIFADDTKPEAVTIPTPEFTTQELADELDIRNFASLVTLNTARWHGKVKDRKAAEHIAAASGGDAAAFETHKRLLAGADEKLKRVHKCIDDARTKHYQMTLPWSTTGRSDQGKRMGGRLLPHTLFMEYTKEMAQAKSSMDKAVGEFVADYQNAITKAQNNLGSRFDPSEYPNPSSIQVHFDLSFDFHPIPIGDDFKGLADQQVAKLANTLEKKNRLMLENAMQETWTRAYELVQQAADRFSNPDAMFHYTLIDKLRDAGETLKYLNVTGDPCIEKVRTTIAKHLTMYDAKDIRGDEALRKRLGEIAVACLKEMQSHAGES